MNVQDCEHNKFDSECRVKVTEWKESFDAFGRKRVSEPTTLFDYTPEYDMPFQWETRLVSGGTVTKDNSGNRFVLEVPTTNWAEALRQTKHYFKYQPGKSQMIRYTFGWIPVKTNVAFEAGYGDDNDWVFLQSNSGTIGWCIRSSATLTSGQELVNQADWNIDNLDGSGSNSNPSGVRLDPTKAEIAHIELEYLGVGSVLVGFIIDTKLIYVHQFDHANRTSAGVYMRTGSLPIRYRIRNIGTTASSTTLDQICCTVISEGGFEDGRWFALAASTTTPTVDSPLSTSTTEGCVLAIRPKLLYKGVTNRARIELEHIEFLCGWADIHYRVLYNPTISSAVWTDPGADSPIEIARVPIVASGGYAFDCGYVTAASGSARNISGQDLAHNIPFTLDLAGTTQDVIAVMARTITGTGNLRCHMGLKIDI